MPPELLLEILVHFGSSRVNGVEGVVCLLHDELLQVLIGRNTYATRVPQDTVRVNTEARNFFLLQPILNPFNIAVSLLSLLNLPTMLVETVVGLWLRS